MQPLLNLIEGKKTYIVAALAVIYLFGGDQGWWKMNESILGIFGFGGLASLRSAVKKAEIP